ncbi:nuclease [Rhizobium rhizosphaerae]|uniref:Nuclease n=1 Tax=Xaviernesmea rhizosphaerae TaxID=1672749 RepID=A0A1Q9AMP9_9HYPH|nr:thermonuclease family protein [Xaviernesmea rhizosphaerae]OLP56672.1 nuclease [Xaviernesmea rhizosphaerae]
MRLLVISLLLASSISQAADIGGRASVIDGDTIEIHGQRIRFSGIDAPETRQTCKTTNGADYRCGKASAEALEQFLAASRPTRCVASGKDRYKRLLAECFRADGKSVSAWMVRNGQALDWPRYSKGAFTAEQAAAKADKLGVWQGPFIPPWDWRRL